MKSPGEWYLSVNSDTTDELSSGNSARSAFPDDVQLLDTTLRDGEQAPGVSLTPDEKVEIAEALEAADIDVIEAGSACTSEGERDCIRRVTDLNLDATVTSFARGIRSDIDHALDCNVDGITLVVPSSDKHIETKVGSTREEVIESSVELVEYATDHDLWVELLGEDGSRADPEFLVDLADAGHEAGADRFCYADTVGHASPEHTDDVVAKLAELGPTSVHTHDDLGFGMTNVHAGLRAGADFVHGTVNGIGERAGNVAVQRVVDVGSDPAGEAGDRRIEIEIGHPADAVAFAFGGTRATGLDHVDVGGRQRLGDLDLLIGGQRDAGSLFAIPQRGV